jgi:nucleoside-diphosphate-sugar epimerase
VAHVVDIAQSAWGLSTATQQATKDPVRAESMSLRLDSSLAHQDLGWTSRLATKQAIDWTVEWELAVRQGIPAQQITCEQITRLMTVPGECHAA